MKTFHAALGLGSTLTDDDVAIAPDFGNRVVPGDELAFIDIQPIHGTLLACMIYNPREESGPFARTPPLGRFF
jgi:hypothetical protein